MDRKLQRIRISQQYDGVKYHQVMVRRVQAREKSIQAILQKEQREYNAS